MAKKLQNQYNIFKNIYKFHIIWKIFLKNSKFQPRMFLAMFLFFLNFSLNVLIKGVLVHKNECIGHSLTIQLQVHVISKQIEPESWDWSWMTDIFLKITNLFYELESKPCMKLFYTKIYTFFYDQVKDIIQTNLITINNHLKSFKNSSFIIFVKISVIQDQSLLSSSIRLEMTWNWSCIVNLCPM